MTKGYSPGVVASGSESSEEVLTNLAAEDCQPPTGITSALTSASLAKTKMLSLPLPSSFQKAAAALKAAVVVGCIGEGVTAESLAKLKPAFIQGRWPRTQVMRPMVLPLSSSQGVFPSSEVCRYS